MSDQQHVTDLTAAYALGALAHDQAEAVETHCAACAACATDLAQMHGIAATLPLACEPMSPSRHLKQRILAQARGDAFAGLFLRNPSRGPVAPAGVWWAAAAAAVIIAGSTMGITLTVERQRAAVEMAAMHDELAVDQSAIAEIAGAQRVWDMSGGTKAHWWHCTLVQPLEKKKAMLVAAMPPAPHGMTFQAWIIRDGKLHNAGTVPGGTKSMMHMPMPVQKGDVIAFTIEPMGGSATPTMPFAMRQTLT